MLKAGFIGAGNRSKKAHYPNVHRLEQDVEMRAVCELDEERLDEVAKKYEFPSKYTNHKEMLDKEDLDVIYCVMNEKWILQTAIDCMNAGKHIFLEKPPGANLEETEQLLETAIANNVYAMVGFQRRYTAITREAMHVVSEKGPVSSVVTAFNKQMLGDAAGGFTSTLWNDVCHIVDLTRYMAGGEPTEVTVYQDKFDSDYYNNYTALVRFENNVTGTIFGNRVSGGRVLRSELHGVGIGCYMKLPEEIEIHEDNKVRTLGGWEIDGVEKEDTDRYEGVLDMHEHFVDCINNNKVPNSDLRDVIHSIRLVDQLEAK